MATIKATNTIRQQDLRDRVMEILGITSDEYYQVQFETAEAYMLGQTDNNHELVSEFLKEPAFWSWWRNQYVLVDEYFELLVTDVKKRVTDPIRVYRTMHINLSCYPDKVLWKKVEQSYMNTIASIIKHKVS